MTSSPVPVPQASVGFERGVGQDFEYLDCNVTLLSIAGQGATQIVRYRIEESGGRSASYTAWPNQASHQRPQPSPSGHVLVHVTGVFDSSMAVFQVFSAGSLDPDGVFVHAKDDETINYAGISITPRHTSVKRTMSGGHVTLATLVVEEKGKTAELNLQTSLAPDHRSTYQYSPDRTIKIAMVNGDHAKGYYHLVAEGGQLPVKNISELKSKRLFEVPPALGDRESAHRVALNFLGSKIENNILVARLELVNAGAETSLTLFPVTASGLLLQLPKEQLRPTKTPRPPVPPSAMRVTIPARHRILVRAHLNLSDYDLSAAKDLQVAWSYLFWHKPRAGGTIFVPYSH